MPSASSQEPGMDGNDSPKFTFTHKELEELYNNHHAATKGVKQDDFRGHNIFKGTKVDGNIYTGINIFLDKHFTHIQYFDKGRWYRDKWVLNDKNKTVIADGYIQFLPWQGTCVVDADMEHYRTVATFAEGKRNGKVITYDLDFKTIIAEGTITLKKIKDKIAPTEERDGTFFDRTVIGSGLGTITTYLKNVIQKRICFDLKSKRIVATEHFKNGKPFSGYFIEFKEMKMNDLPPPPMVVYHCKDGKILETLTGKEYFTKNKDNFTSKIASTPRAMR